jgi:heat shock protein HslJ
MNRVTVSFNSLVVLILLAGIGTLSCAGGASPREEATGFDGIREREWRLTALISASGAIDLSRHKLENDGMGDFYTLRFDKDRLNGKAAPNHYSAPYTLGINQALSIGPPAATLMMAFIEPELKEHDYFIYLSRVSNWIINNGKLELYTSGEDNAGAVLIFSR